MKTLRLSIVALFMVVMLASPLFSFAQIVDPNAGVGGAPTTNTGNTGGTVGPATGKGGSVSKSDWDNLENARAAAADAFINAKKDPNDPAYVSAMNQLMDRCKAIGEIVEGITNKYSTMFNVESRTCSVGIITPNKTPQDVFGKYTNRNFTVTHAPQNVVQSHMLALAGGSAAVFDAQMYETLQKREDTSLLTGMWAFFSQAINYIVEILGNIVAAVFAFIATFSLQVLSWVLDYTVGNTDYPNVIDKGWVIVRDFMNVFFIAALILMGLGTILRWNDYAYNSKNFLFNLIVMAILINFSKVIVEAMIGLSDMFVVLFRPKEGFMDYSQTILQAYLTGGDGIYGLIGQGRGLTEGFANVITKLISLAVISIAYIGVAGLMFVRLFGLWFIIMLSPAMFALYVIPYTRTQALQLFGTLLKYLIWGPVAMFFFRIGYVFMEERGHNGYNDGFLDTLVIAGFVYFGYYIAKKSGMYGAAAVTSRVDKYGKAAAWGTGNLFWRGSLPGWVAGGAGAVAASKGWAREDAGKVWGEKVKGTIGKTTAWIENQPKAAKTRLIDNPNKERKNVVDASERRIFIKRNYLKDFDEEFAKKLKPEDVMYAMGQDSFNESKFNNIMDHGSSQSKMALVMAMREGVLQKRMKDLNWDPGVQEQAKQKIIKFAWKDSGRKEAALANPKNKTFMSEELAYENGKPVMLKKKVDGKEVEYHARYIDRDVQNKPKNSAKWDDSASIPEKLKNSYVKIDPERKYTNKDPESDKNKEKDKDKGIILTDKDKPVRDESSEDRMKRYRKASEGK